MYIYILQVYYLLHIHNITSVYIYNLVYTTISMQLPLVDKVYLILFRLLPTEFRDDSEEEVELDADTELCQAGPGCPL